MRNICNQHKKNSNFSCNDNNDNNNHDNGNGRPPGGRGLGSNHAWMCVSKSEGNGSFFSLQGSEMIENISLKRGVKFAASLNMGKNLW